MRVFGRVDGFANGALWGWALRPERPAERLIVFAETAPDVFQPFRADLYRADVQHATGCDGYCGFAIPLAVIAWSGPLRVLVGDADVALPGSPCVPRPVAPASSLGRKNDLLFRVEARPTALTGWVSSRQNPFDRRILVLASRDGMARRARACLFSGTDASEDGDGFHGFSIAVPHGAKTLRLFDEASGTTLYRGRP